MSHLIDLTGQKFGRLTVLYKDNQRITKSGSYWICKCECGNIKSVKSSSLRRGEIQSCGCLQKEKTIEARNKSAENLIGKRFGKLVVLQRDMSNTSTPIWICQCDCGKLTSVRAQDLKRHDGNQTVSCGCYHQSIGEKNILSILTDNNIDYISQYTFTDLPKSRFDFAILNNQTIIRLIEYDGEQHYKDIPAWGGLKLQQQRDKVKNEYAIDHNIPLIRIPYWERDNITLDMILGDKYLITK